MCFLGRENGPKSKGGQAEHEGKRERGKALLHRAPDQVASNPCGESLPWSGPMKAGRGGQGHADFNSFGHDFWGVDANTSCSFSPGVLDSPGLGALGGGVSPFGNGVTMMKGVEHICLGV